MRTPGDNEDGHRVVAASPGCWRRPGHCRAPCCLSATWGIRNYTENVSSLENSLMKLPRQTAVAQSKDLQTGNVDGRREVTEARIKSKQIL